LLNNVSLYIWQVHQPRSVILRAQIVTMRKIVVNLSLAKPENVEPIFKSYEIFIYEDTH
jgi:hypothetical protein